MKSPNKLKQLAVAVPAAIALGLGASACSSPEEPAPTVTETVTVVDPNPQVILSDEIKLDQTEVISGSVGALKDVALDATYDVPDVIAYDDTRDVVAKARKTVSKIDNEEIANRASSYIDAKLAETTIYADNDYYTFVGAPDNAEAINLHEATIDLIEGEAAKALAEKNLDLGQALEAVDAASDYSSNQEAATGLLAAVEDAGIKALAEKAIAGDTDAKSELRKLARETCDAIEKASLDARSSLVNGSGHQAKYINDQIADFNATQESDGQ